MFEVFFAHIRQRISLTEDEATIIKTYLTPKKLRKKQYLLQEGDVCKNFSFVERGLLRSYNVDDKGAEHMIQFAWEGWWMVDIFSFLTGEQSTYNIDAIEDTELLMIQPHSYEELMLKVPRMERYFRILFQNNIIAKERRLISSISHAAEEKYLNLVQTHPGIIQRIPQNLIASYIGITPETLSRVRRNLASKK